MNDFPKVKYFHNDKKSIKSKNNLIKSMKFKINDNYMILKKIGIF